MGNVPHTLFYYIAKLVKGHPFKAGGQHMFDAPLARVQIL